MSKTPANFTPPILETARTIMRCPQLQDFEASAKMWADPKVVEFITGKPSTFEESWARLLRNIGHWHALGYGGWIIEDKQTGKFLGQVGLGDKKRNIAPELDDLPEIGWVLATSAHGRGIATETVKAAIEWADTHIIASKTFCMFAPEHKASQHVAHKCGYEEMMTISYHDQTTLIMARNSPAQAETKPT
ncbi:MAG: GNAT family N-acetyltransferase [Rhizobiaceae bacterium]|nr:GNAT family N-acetyltransferase [Rhizobiaceae bacterium]PCI05463.1 MAG: GNAT family N-acetyltransferase [Hyphomicrobiales bacterium]